MTISSCYGLTCAAAGSLARRCSIPQSIHHEARRDDRVPGACCALRIAFFDPVGRHDRDPIIAVRVGAHDSLVVGRECPRERLLAVVVRGRGRAPKKPTVLAGDRVSYLEVPHDRILRRPNEMLGRTDEQYLAGSSPSALEIRY